MSLVHHGEYTGRPVVIKYLPCEEITRDELHLKCYELMVAAQLDSHPTIVDHLGFSVSPPYVSIVMETCKTNLYKYLHGGVDSVAPPHVPERERKVLAWGAARATAHLHSKGFVHRDLKSMNVLVSQVEPTDGCNCSVAAKLCDFGETITQEIATSDVRGDRDQGLIGTANWAAP